jgi:N-methyl-L-tryptophan oxidase
MQYDVIVIGAGSMGMAAGYFLSKSGKKTLLLDSFEPPHNRGSHHGDTRIIRHAYAEGEEYVPLVLKAQELWNELESKTGRKLFHQTGVLSVGLVEDNAIQNVISSAKKYNLPLETMRAEEINHRWPGISLSSEYIGCFEPASGVLKCEECIEAYHELALSEGATILTNQKVTGIEVLDDRVKVNTESTTFYSSSLVISAGAWSGELLKKLDLQLPIQPVRKTFAWFDADEELYQDNNFPAFAFDTKEGLFYGFPSINGSGLKVGRHDGGNSINPDEPLTPFGKVHNDQADLEQFLKQYMPKYQRFKEGKTCIYSLTPDEDFIIDLHPSYSNVAIAAGFSGHGFKFSSVVGHILAELIVSGNCGLDITPFTIGRFKDEEE